MTEEEIYEIAKKYVKEHLQKNWGIEIVLSKLIEKKDGLFAFSYVSKDFLKTGDWLDNICDGHPIIVREEDGKVFETGAIGDTDDYIEHIKKYGNSDIKFDNSQNTIATLEEMVQDELVDWEKKLDTNPDHFNEMITMIRYSIPFEDAPDYIKQLHTLMAKETNETILEVYRQLMERLQEMV